MLTDQDARRIASVWHGGQATALYALASTGAITADVSDEITETARAESKTPPEQRANPMGFTNLIDLRTYCRQNGPRGPVDGWNTPEQEPQTMKPFNFDDPAAIAAAVESAGRLPEGKYPMRLNRTDLRTVLTALHTLHLEGVYNEPEVERAGSLYSDMLQTLNIELI